MVVMIVKCKMSGGGVASGDDKYNTEVVSYSVPRRARAFSVLAPASSLRA